MNNIKRPKLVKYPLNSDGTLMTPLDLYSFQIRLTRGFDVDHLPENWVISGRTHPVDLDQCTSDDKDKYVALVDFAIEWKNGLQNKDEEKLKFDELLKVMKSGCAGVNYYFTFNVASDTGHGKKTHQAVAENKKTCQAVVYVSWDKSREVVSFEDVSDGTSSQLNSPIDTTAPIAPTETWDLGCEETPDLSEHRLQKYEVSSRPITRLMSKRYAVTASPTINYETVLLLLDKLGQPTRLDREETFLEMQGRLRMVMGILDYQGQSDRVMKALMGMEQLPLFEKDITEFSIVRGGASHGARKWNNIDDEDFDDRRIDWDRMTRFDYGNEDDKPISGCSFSQDGEMLATCDSSSFAIVDKVHTCKDPRKLVGHKKSLTDVAFSPSGKLLATASVDQTANLWKCEKDSWSLVDTFKGHKDSLKRIAFHPSGRFLGTTSLDKTCRLWDIDYSCELLRVEGDQVSSRIAFHCGGSLAASCGVGDAIVRGWDVRTGSNICIFKGHVGQVLDFSFSLNGYHLATAGEDKSVRIWDLRKNKSLIKFHAHEDVISQVKFEPQEGLYLFTGSLDKTVKVWSSTNFVRVRTLSEEHDEGVTLLDVVKGGEVVATVNNRTVVVWRAKKY